MGVENLAASKVQPLESAWPVDKSQVTLTDVRAIMVSTDGLCKVDLLTGSTGLSFPLAPNVWHPMRVTKVYSTSDCGSIFVGY